MKNIWIGEDLFVKGIKGKTLYVDLRAAGGVAFDTHHVPQAIKFLKGSSYIEKIVLMGMNGVNLTIDRETSLKDAMDEWKKKYDTFAPWISNEEKSKRKDKSYLEIKRDLLQSLLNIKPCDLTSQETSIQDATRFCKDVLNVLKDCGYVVIDMNGVDKAFVEALECIGCVGYDDANSKFKTSGAESVFEVIDSKNNIEFPLSLFSYLLTSYYNYNIRAASVMNNGYTYKGNEINEPMDFDSLLTTWVDAQKEKTLSD